MTDTHDSDPTSAEPERLLDGLDPEDLDGHTIEELSDYLDAGRQPRNASIENSPGSRIALDALVRLRRESWAMLESEALVDPDRNKNWMSNVMASISREARAGRDIPITHPNAATRLRITEGSVRGLIRAAGDGTAGAILGTVQLDGDVTVPAEPITVNITVTAPFGQNLSALAELLRAKITDELVTHTELTIATVNVTVHDIHIPRERQAGDDT
jgi:uncharacterized alkaline shock family protein YloU